MADKNQTPAPKVSNESSGDFKGQREEPAMDRMESGFAEGVTPENRIESTEAKTTSQQQQQREEKLDNGHDSLDIKYGQEGQSKQDHADHTQKPDTSRQPD